MSIASTRRDSGATKTRIDSDDPGRDEATVSSYIRGGTRRIVLCDSYDEANAFQWFAIEQLSPHLNVDRRPWDATRAARFGRLLTALTAGPHCRRDELKGSGLNGPGLYVLEHQHVPVPLGA